MNHSQLDAWLDEARALVAEGDFHGARTCLLNTTARFPDCAEAWKDLGIAENKLGNQMVAERHLLQALALDASDADAWSSLGGVYVELEQFDKALEAFERGLAVSTQVTYPLLNFLTMAALVGDYASATRTYAATLADARRECEDQVRQSENLPWCYYDLAQMLLFAQDGSDFREMLREAIARSHEWQAASAKRTYQMLAGTIEFRDSASDALDEFAHHMVPPHQN
jgi:tetratricopeptide (TPR) repeat protein